MLASKSFPFSIVSDVDFIMFDFENVLLRIHKIPLLTLIDYHEKLEQCKFDIFVELPCKLG